MRLKRLVSDDRGLTLLEMIIALGVFSVIVGASLGFLRSQSRAFRVGSDGMGTLQNLRFAANQVELDLRSVGSNVPDGQPFLVYAGDDVVAFNGDHTSNVANDPFAVYVDTDAPDRAVTALGKLNAITIPQTGVLYPDTTYSGPGGIGISPAETIVLYFRPDSSTSRVDDYGLFRQVNDKTELVSRNLLKTPGEPFFEYLWVRDVGGTIGIDTVSSAMLPLSHSVPIHGSTADSGSFARIDSIRGVKVNLTATNGRAGAAQRVRSFAVVVRMPNAGLRSKRTCGSDPIFGSTMSANASSLPTGERVVDLGWGAAVDEVGGEADVMRYVVWRREASQTSWGNPYLSIPAGNPSYTYQDQAAVQGTSYFYAVAAQDCTPSLSTMVSTGPVTP